MKYLKENDKGASICFKCESLVKTIYRYRNVPFNDATGIVNNLLVGVCTICNSTTSIPHQSTPQIKRSYNK